MQSSKTGQGVVQRAHDLIQDWCMVRCTETFLPLLSGILPTDMANQTSGLKVMGGGGGGVGGGEVL